MTGYSGISGANAFPLEKSDYLQFWLIEKRAIEEHKWYLSERLKCDVGFSYAQWNWIMGGYRADWVRKIRHSGANH